MLGSVNNHCSECGGKIQLWDDVMGFCRIKFREVEIGYADRISKEAVMHHARY